jgi:hypothetical protein
MAYQPATTSYIHNKLRLALAGLSNRLPTYAMRRISGNETHAALTLTAYRWLLSQLLSGIGFAGKRV